MLFYNSETALGQFYRPDSTGDLHLVREYPDWKAGISQIYSGCFQVEENHPREIDPLLYKSAWKYGLSQIYSSEETDLLFYNPANGRGSFYSTDVRGNLNHLMVGELTPGESEWKLIIPGRHIPFRRSWASEFVESLSSPWVAEAQE